MEYNELQQIIYSGIKVTNKNLFRFSDHGYNIPADGLYTTRPYYEQYKKKNWMPLLQQVKRMDMGL